MGKRDSHKLDQEVKKYLIECMNFDDYRNIFGDALPATTQEKIKGCERLFRLEMGEETIKERGQIQALQDWLQGLCMVQVAYDRHDVLELAVKWGSLPVDYTDKQAEKITENYWNFMANKLNQLFNGYHVPEIKE